MRIRYPFKNEPIETDTLTVTVTDGDNPIENATVTIGSDSETTDATGVVEFDLEYGDYTATVEADGYTTATEELAFRSNHKNFTVTLESAVTTGTVTVTCQDSESNPVNEAICMVSTTETPTSADDYIGMGISGSDGVAIIYEFDKQTYRPTEVVAQIPYGDYYLLGNASDTHGNISYTGALTVDGNEEITITLESAVTTGTVTVTCEIPSGSPTTNVTFVIGTEPMSQMPSDPTKMVGIYNGNYTEPFVVNYYADGQVQGTDIPFGSYYTYAQCSTLKYSGELTIDGDEQITVTFE